MPEFVEAKDIAVVRLTRAEHFAFWRERFTDAEIREIGACLDFLGRDQVAA